MALSIGWQTFGRDGQNVKAVTSQKLTDIGRAPTFYGGLAEMAKA